MIKILVYQNNNLDLLPKEIKKQFIKNMTDYRGHTVTIDLLLNEIPSAIWLFLVHGVGNNKLIGSLRFFMIEKDMAKRLQKYTAINYCYYVSAVVISEKDRGHGYVQYLLNKVKDITSSKILLEVDKENTYAIKAYKKANFKKIASYNHHNHNTLLLLSK
jgi:RimJ/RimL family protein N-acetyltransferase